MMLVLVFLALVLPDVAISDMISGRIADFIPEQQGAMEYSVHALLTPEQQFQEHARDIRDFEQFPDKSKLPQKSYSWQEVAECDGEGDRPLFLAIRGCVYDFTAFGHLHPGGPAPLKKHAGHDATDFLCSMNMPMDAQKLLLRRFLVGTIDPKPKPLG